MTSVNNDLSRQFYYYFPEWRENKDDIETSYENSSDETMNNQKFNFSESIDEKVKFSTYVYIRENLNFYPIYLAVGLLLFTYPNYRVFYAPFRKLVNWFWSKIKIQSLPWNIFAVIAQHHLIQFGFIFILSSILYYFDTIFDTKLKKYLKNIWFNIALFFVIIGVVYIIYLRNSNNINNKITLMCQSWMRKNDSSMVSLMKKFIFAQNTILSSDILQCLIGISVSLHVITACFKSFVPVMSNGWSGKRFYLLFALLLTTFLSIIFMSLSYSCSFANNDNIIGLNSGEKWKILFMNLNSNVLYNIIVPMLACMIVGIFSYSQLQTAILNSKFKITGNDYKQGQTILKLTNKNDLKEKWKWYNNNNPNGILLNDIDSNAFNNVYTQTTNGENDPNFKSQLQTLIDKYNLPVSSDSLYMILKVNNKIIDGNTSNTNGFSVFMSILGDLFLYMSNVALVTTFVNGRNWGLLPIIGFDTEDESFTYKNWVECLVNVNNDKITYFKGQKWFGGDLTQNTIDWLKQYNKLSEQQEDIRERQLDSFRKEFFDEDGNYIAGSIYKFINLSQKFFFIPELVPLITKAEEEVAKKEFEEEQKEEKNKKEQNAINQTKLGQLGGGEPNNTSNNTTNNEPFNNTQKFTSNTAKISNTSDYYVDLKMNTVKQKVKTKNHYNKIIYGFFPTKNEEDQVIQINIASDDIETKLKKFLLDNVESLGINSKEFNQDIEAIEMTMDSTFHGRKARDKVEQQPQKGGASQVIQGTATIAENQKSQKGNITDAQITNNTSSTVSTIEITNEKNIEILEGGLKTLNELYKSVKPEKKVDYKQYVSKFSNDVEKDKLIEPEIVPGSMKLVKDKLNTFMYNAGYDNSGAEGDYYGSLLNIDTEKGGMKRYQKSSLEKAVKFLTLGLIKIASSNFISNNAILYTYLFSSIAMTVLQNKKEVIEGFINNISDYYQYHKLKYIYHIEDNENCGCDILDLNNNKNISKEDLLYPQNNSIMSENLTNAAVSNKQNSPEIIQAYNVEIANNQSKTNNTNNTNNIQSQQGGNKEIPNNNVQISNENNSFKKEEIIKYEKLPKEPSAQYNEQLNEIQIQKFQNFDVVGTEYNFGTTNSPIYANIPSNNPKISAHVVTDNFTIVEEGDENNNGDKSTKKPLIVDVNADFVKGPINNLFKYYQETNIEKYISYIGSASLFDTELKINCIDSQKTKNESHTRYCKDKVNNYDLEKPCDDSIPFDGIINVTSKKKSMFRSVLTKMIFLGVDYKKLFLERYKFTPPPLKEEEDGENKGKSYVKYLNNLIVGMIVGTIAIDNASTYISKHYSYIPPNAGVLTKALGNSREYLYNSSKTLSNILPNGLFTLMSVVGWFIIKEILNTVLSPYLTKEITSDSLGLGTCNLEAIAAPYIVKPNNFTYVPLNANSNNTQIAEARYATNNNQNTPIAEATPMSGGGKKKNYIIRIGKSNTKYYDNQFYEFYKFNDLKQKYQKIKNLYINPVSKQLKAKNKVFGYDDNILEKLIQSL